MPGHWNTRSALNYYRTVRQWLDDLGPLDSLIDVGCLDTPVATWGTARHRYALDRWRVPQLPGVVGIRADWLAWQPPHRFELAICLQVIEHIAHEQVGPFVDKLFAAADLQIISVPWQWPVGACEYHVHDPIDEAKFLQLCGGRRPRRKQIIRDGTCERLVALFGPPADDA